MKITYLQDPGHGWLLVPSADLQKVGMSGRDFTTFSYRSKDGVYALEEDCDASRYLDRLKERGVAFELVSKHVNHSAPCRNWPCNSEGVN